MLRSRTTAPEVSDINFLALASLEVLPALQPLAEECEAIGQHINELDRAIPHAAERYSFLWKGYQGTSPVSLLGQQAEVPEVIEARAEMQSLKDQLKVLHANAAAARGELELAKAQLVERLRPAMTAALGPPLASLIAGLQAATAVERLCGQVQGHGPTRQAVTALLAYLTEVTGRLEGGE